MAPAPRLDVLRQPIGDLKASSFNPYPPEIDGILGLGPIDLTVGTLSPYTGRMIISIITNLQTWGRIKHITFGIYFGPSANKSIPSWDGALTYGGADPHLVWMRFLYRLLSARCLHGLYASCTVQGQPHICPSYKDISSQTLLGLQHDFVYVWYPHHHPLFHCWGYHFLYFA